MQNKYNNIFLVIKTALSDIVENDIEIDKNCIKDIFNIGVKHQILPMLFNGLNKINSNFEGKKVFEKLIFKYIYYDQMQLYNIELIEKAFNENFVDYMLLKGASIKKIYPSSELRLMGDIDILINPAQYESAASIMSDFGFIEKKNTDHEWIWRNSNGIVVELHKRLIPSYNDDYYAYFKDSWEKAKPSGVGSSYIMPPEDEYIYFFTHLAKHYRDGGIGLKHLIDIWVFRKMHPLLDNAYITKELKKLELNVFHDNIIDTIRVWFDGEKETELTNHITERIIESGVYGIKEKYDAANAARKSACSSSVSSARNKELIYSVFMPYSKMKTKYPVLRKCPFLLPIMWVVRWIDAIIQKPDNIKERSIRIKKIDKEIVENYRQELKLVGLAYNLKKASKN